MYIGGLQKFSLLDYPEHLSAIIFTQGCNFRCQFCYNPMLVRPVGKLIDTSSVSNKDGKRNGRLLDEAGLFAFLDERYGKLDAVVITGGEPTMHSDLPEFMEKIRRIGYKIKLDTNGSYPEMLERVLKRNLADYIAMDLKASPAKYDLVSGVQPDLAKIRKSIKMILAGGLPYEFRSTIVPELHEPEDIELMGELIKGADKWFLQQFQSDQKLVNDKFEKMPAYPDEVLDNMCAIASKFVKHCEVR